MMESWQIAITVTLAVVTVSGFFFTLYRWWVHRSDKRHEAHLKRFDECCKRFEAHEARIERNEVEIRSTRDELHTQYPPNEQLEKLEEKLMASMDSVHHRLGGIAKDLNQAIGELSANRAKEMEQIMTRITRAIRSRDDE